MRDRINRLTLLRQYAWTPSTPPVRRSFLLEAYTSYSVYIAKRSIKLTKVINTHAHTVYLLVLQPIGYRVHNTNGYKKNITSPTPNLLSYTHWCLIDTVD